MFNIFKSRNKRVNDELEWMYGVVGVGIAALESTSFHPVDREKVAIICRHMLLGCKPGEEGVRQLERIMAETRGKDVQTYEATKLVGAIVSSENFARSELKAKSGWVTAMFTLAAIQGRIEAFMQRQGVPKWGAQYFRRSEFEALPKEKEGETPRVGR